MTVSSERSKGIARRVDVSQPLACPRSRADDRFVRNSTNLPSQSGHAKAWLNFAHSSYTSQQPEVRCSVQAPEASRGGRPCSVKKQLAPKANHGAYCWLRLFDGI